MRQSAGEESHSGPSVERDQIAIPPSAKSTPRTGVVVGLAAQNSPMPRDTNNSSSSDTHSHRFGDSTSDGQGYVVHNGDVIYNNYIVRSNTRGHHLATSLASDGVAGISNAPNAPQYVHHGHRVLQLDGGPIDIPRIHTDEPLHDESTATRVITLPSPEVPNGAMNPGFPINDEHIGGSQPGEAGSSNTLGSESTPDAATRRRRGRGGNWQQLLDLTARKAEVELSDGGPMGKATVISWNDCRIILEAQPNPAVDRRHRRLLVEGLQPEQEKPRMFWVPLTNTEVSRTVSKLVVQHSNCVQLRNNIKNRKNNYSATYDCAKPNVKLEFYLVNEVDAKHLEHHLLLLDELHEAEDAGKVFSGSSCTVWCTRSKKVSLDDRSSLFIWHESGTIGQIRRTLDFGCFSPELDFEVEKFEQSIMLHIRYLRKLQYTPKDVGHHASWPPNKLKDDEDGGPACTRLWQSTSKDNAISIPTAGNGLDLLNVTIGTATSWEVQGCWPVEVRSKFGILNGLFRQSFEAGWLTLWTKGDMVRCLIRYNAQSDTSQWLSWTLRRVDSRQHQTITTPTPQIDDHEVTLTNLSLYSGPFLSMDPSSSLQPTPSIQRRRGSLTSPDDGTKIQIRFSNETDKDNFLGQQRPQDGSS